MRKTITHQGQYKGEIIVSPNATLPYKDWGRGLSEDRQDRLFYNIITTIGNSHWLTIIDVKENNLLSLLYHLEKAVVEQLVLTSEGKTIESQLLESGYK